jgi:hypothetical protein
VRTCGACAQPIHEAAQRCHHCGAFTPEVVAHQRQLERRYHARRFGAWMGATVGALLGFASCVATADGLGDVIAMRLLTPILAVTGALIGRRLWERRAMATR